MSVFAGESRKLDVRVTQTNVELFGEPRNRSGPRTNVRLSGHTGDMRGSLLVAGRLVAVAMCAAAWIVVVPAVELAREAARVAFGERDDDEAVLLALERLAARD